MDIGILTIIDLHVMQMNKFFPSWISLGGHTLQ